MKYREISKKLQSLGCNEIDNKNSGSHRKWFNPKTDRATVIPNWQGKDLKMGTLKAIIRQLKINWKDFEKA